MALTGGNGDKDSLSINNSDQPVTQLTSRQFDGDNYISWSRQARLALAAKQKLGFVTGGCIKPTDPAQLEKWLRNDSMVFCWILNSLTPEISSTLLYSRSSKELWDELAERYGQANGPLIFQLKREMANISQGEDNIPTYFSELKRLWDEYQSVEDTPTCTCGALQSCKCKLLKRIHDLETRNQLLQFLMGLNPQFDQIRGQLLAMDPLPPLNKAYYILHQDERQKHVSGLLNTARNTDVYAAHHVQGNSRTSNTNTNNRDHKRLKIDRFCDYCKIKGHTIDACFKIYGYPDWYKGDKGKGIVQTDWKKGDRNFSKGSRQFAAQAYAVPEDIEPADPLQPHNCPPHDNRPHSTPDLINTVCQEVLKALQGQPLATNFVQSGNPAESAAQNFSGPFH